MEDGRNVSERCLSRNYQDDADQEIAQADFDIHDQPADLQIQENIAEAVVLEEEVDLEEDWQNDIRPQSTHSEQQSETTAAVNIHVHGHSPDPNSVSPEMRTEMKQNQHETSCDNEQGEPPSKKSRTEDSQPSSKTRKALALVLGKSKDVQTYEKLKNNVTKSPNSRYPKEHYVNHLAHIQVQVLKKYKEVNKAIKEWLETFQKSHQKTSTEKELKTDLNISATWRKRKIASELLRV